MVECGPCPVFASFTLAFALQLRKKHGKTSVTVQYTYYQKHPHVTKPSQTHTLQNPLIHTLQNKTYKTGAVWENPRRVCFLHTKTTKLELDGCQRDDSCEILGTPICTCFNRLEPVCEKSHTHARAHMILVLWVVFIVIH
jgi:hypothetical protein